MFFYLFIHISKKNYKLIAIDLGKRQGLDTDPNTIQHINFTSNLDWAGDRTNFFSLDEVKGIILGFHLEMREHYEGFLEFVLV